MKEKKTISLEVPITEFDIELFKNIIKNNAITKWTFEDKEYIVNLEIMTQDEHEQRRK